MKRFTDTFICRPVLAVVVSLLIVVFGVRSFTSLSVREYPRMDNTLITVVTSYPGATADLMQGFITTVLEQSVAGAEGIDYMTSTSTQGTSEIDVYAKLGADPNVIFTDVNSLVQSQIGFLPKASQAPVITKTTGSSTGLMYIGFFSDHMSAPMISDYLMRVVKPMIFTVPGISEVNVLGAGFFAMRIWLDTQRMAALGVTMAEVKSALTANNFQSAPGQIKGDYVKVDVAAQTDATTVGQFEQMVVKESGSTIIRVKDVARVELGQTTYDGSVVSDGKQVVTIAINPTPEANSLTVADGVKAILPKVEQGFPPSLTSKILYDSTLYITASIKDVQDAMIEAVIIVIVVIFLFMGSLRTIVIPIVTIPLSLIGAFFVMYILGYSINLLTLLALVIAVGLVVDDAIVVVENIYRHLEEGMKPFQAAIAGAREIAFPVVVMTLTLVAVFLPIGFMGGITGNLFKEFAFTLAGSVIVSGILALTLSPMMSAKILNESIMQARFVIWVDAVFHKFRMLYQKFIGLILNFRVAMVCVAVVMLACIGYFYTHSRSELAPAEDEGAVFTIGVAPEIANLDYDQVFTPFFDSSYKKVPQAKDFFTINGMSPGVFSILTLKSWDERPGVTSSDIKNNLQKMMSSLPAFMTIVAQPPALPTGGKGLAISFQVVSLKPLSYIYPYAMKLMEAAAKSGRFSSIIPDVLYNKPLIKIHINRSKAALMGINMSQVGDVLATAMGGNYINRFSLEDRSYEVIPQNARYFRLTKDRVKQMRIKTSTGAMIPLSTIVTITESVQANQLTQFQQLNSVLLGASLAPGQTTGTALTYLEEQAKNIFPDDITYNFSGSSRQYVQEGSALVWAFMLAIIIIYLVLSAQFESFRDPFVILISVPMSVFGAMLPIFFNVVTLNIYTEVGLIALIGLISKHGILIVQFANDLQIGKGMSKHDAIIEAAGTRLRPVLMTTAAMVFGLLPLVFATGAGAVSRNGIGLVIVFGMLIGTIFTLIMVPTFYSLIASQHTEVPKADIDDPMINETEQAE